MKKFVVYYNPFDTGLLSEYVEVEGKTAIDAARNFVKGKYNKVKRSGDYDVNLCLVEGHFDKGKNVLYECGNRCWYKCENI